VCLELVHNSTLAWFGLAQFNKIYNVNTPKPNRAEPGQACLMEPNWHDLAQFMDGAGA